MLPVKCSTTVKDVLLACGCDSGRSGNLNNKQWIPEPVYNQYELNSAADAIVRPARYHPGLRKKAGRMLLRVEQLYRHVAEKGASLSRKVIVPAGRSRRRYRSTRHCKRWSR
jgi:hypothetical protein